MKRLLIITLFCFISIYARAQEILPTELFQIYKYWQMDVSGFDKNTYDYVQTIDKQWGLRIPPQKDENGITLLFGYFKDKAWYKDEEYRMMLTYDKKSRSPKGILYSFTNIDTWLNYKKQMEVMNAESLATQPSQGGIQSTYRVNDIIIYLTDFPPGIQGPNRTYQALLTTQNDNH